MSDESETSSSSSDFTRVITTSRQNNDPNRKIVQESPANSNTIVGLSRTEMSELGFSRGDTAFLKGKNGLETVCTVVQSRVQRNNKIRMNKVIRNNLGVKLGDKVSIFPCPEIQLGIVVNILPVDNNYTPEQLNPQHILKHILKPYFANGNRPIHLGDVFSAYDIMEFKVTHTDPAPFCIVAPDTFIYVEGEPVKPAMKRSKIESPLKLRIHRPVASSPRSTKRAFNRVSTATITLTGSLDKSKKATIMKNSAVASTSTSLNGNHMNLASNSSDSSSSANANNIQIGNPLCVICNENCSPEIPLDNSSTTKTTTISQFSQEATSTSITNYTARLELQTSIAFVLQKLLKLSDDACEKIMSTYTNAKDSELRTLFCMQCLNLIQEGREVSNKISLLDLQYQSLHDRFNRKLQTSFGRHTPSMECSGVRTALRKLITDQRR